MGKNLLMNVMKFDKDLAVNGGGSKEFRLVLVG